MGPANTTLDRTRLMLAGQLCVHLAGRHEPRLEEFPVGGGSHKLKVRLRIRNLPALPVHGQDASFGHRAVAVRFAADPVA